MKTLLFFLLSAFFTLSVYASGKNHSASPDIIPLWTGPVPGFPKEYKHRPFVRVDPQRITETSRAFMRIFLADPTKATGQALLIFPGGGYSILADKKEGDDIAKYFAKKGVTCFVVCYRVSKKHTHPGYRFPGPLLDARQAMRYVKTHANQFKINAKKIGVIGFSAGGHLAGMVATTYNDNLAGDPVSNISVRPAFAALIYPVVSMIEPNTHAGSRKNLLGNNPPKQRMITTSIERRVTKNTPPLFIVHNQFDVVTSQNSLLLALAATKAKTPCELHLYPAKPHGFGMGRPNDTEKSQPAMLWPELLEKFMLRQ